MCLTLVIACSDTTEPAPAPSSDAVAAKAAQEKAEADATAAKAEADLQKLLAKAAKAVTVPADPGELVVYSGRKESLVGAIIEQFRVATGIEVKVKYG